ncbi:MAG: oxidative damage protection protein [Chloroflexi bacterium]|nr:oxidative damage protection protein [Chloroflexota bacterium]
MARMVQCVKLGRELPGLERPPVPGELGQRIFDEVSAEAWQLWQRHATLLMNHYGLNMADPRTRQSLQEEMEEFFFGENARVPEGWVDPSQAGSAKGGGAPAAKGGGAPAAKGGGAPRKG